MFSQANTSHKEKRTATLDMFDLRDLIELAKNEPLPKGEGRIENDDLKETETNPVSGVLKENSVPREEKISSSNSKENPSNVVKKPVIVPTKDFAVSPNKSTSSTPHLVAPKMTVNGIYQKTPAKISSNVNHSNNADSLSKNGNDSSILNSRDNLKVIHEGVKLLPLKTPVKKAEIGKENLLNSNTNKRCVFGSTKKPPVITPLSKGRPLLNTDKPAFKRQLITPTSILKINERKIHETSETLRVNNLEFVVLKVLGKGGSSTVYHCIDDDSKENRAIKCVSLDSSSESFKREIEVLKNLQDCDRIIKMYDYEMTKQHLYVVLELGEIDLSYIINDFNKTGTPTPAYLILFYWMEMLHAVEQIHSKGIIHSDLKPANFLQVRGRLKLIDFGISSSVQDENTSVIKSVAEGTGNYISPEALNCERNNNTDSPSFGKNRYRMSYKADVWSLGCILYQLIYKKTPFQHIKHPMQKLLAIANGEKIEFLSIDDTPKKFLETAENCLKFNAKSRPSVKELILDFRNFDFT